MRKLIIIGTGGHATSVASIAISCGYEVGAKLEPTKHAIEALSRQGLISLGIQETEGPCICVALGDNFIRQELANHCKLHLKDCSFPLLIHPTSIVGPDSTFGEGTVVMPGVVIGPNTNIGRFCVINSAASIDHDCNINDYASVAPGATLGGSVSVGERSAVCIGASVRHKTIIGSDTVLGGGSYLNNDLPSNVTAYGLPAKVVGARSSSDPYL